MFWHSLSCGGLEQDHNHLRALANHLVAPSQYQHLVWNTGDHKTTKFGDQG